MRTDLEKEAGALILKEYGSFFRLQYLQLTSFFAEDVPQEANKSYVPIQVYTNPQELVPLVELVCSDNTLMTKVLSALSSLCVEVNVLKADAFERQFQFLSIYEVYGDTEVCSQINAICLLTSFLTRCNDVLKNICSQLFALYTEEIINSNEIQLHYIINHIGELFTIIVLLELLINNSSLSKNWQKFMKSINTIADRHELLQMDDEQLRSIKLAIENINAKLMTDNIVIFSLNNLSSLKTKLVNKNLTFLNNEMTLYMRHVIGNLDKLVQEKPTHNNMYKCVKINALFVLNYHLFGVTDKKLLKSLMDLNLKAHSIPILGTNLFLPEQFLQKHISPLFGTQNKHLQTMLKARQNHLSLRKTLLAKDVANLQALSKHWILSVEESFSVNHSQLNASEMNYLTKTLMRGLEIASEVHNSLLTLVNLHLALNVEVSRSVLTTIFDAIEVLKSMKEVVARNSIQIVATINMVIQHLLYQATATIVDVKKNFLSDKNYANTKLDELTCIVIAEKSLKGAATLDRIVVANIAISFLPNSIVNEDNCTRIGLLLEKVQTLLSFTKTFNEYCKCSWILYHETVIPMYVEQNFPIQMNAHKLKYFVDVLQECVVLLYDTEKDFEINKSEKFADDTTTMLQKSIFNDMSQQIETNLRLHMHLDLQLDIMNPFTTDMVKKTLLVIDNFRILNIYMSVIPSVEHYLSTMYYNLTTVVLSDWKTYGEMRQMAKYKFNLTTVEDNLPTQTLEQGLDVLEIMRNIHIFVSKYLYNLNNQIFIEKSSNNRHLNSINIKHVANSIRTHGTGIMNTTVNCTYQFLKKKFFTFSQFLYDEHIKSRLIKDARNLKENAIANDGIYLYKNAEKFNKGIRNLGLSDDGESYLDLFRDLIGQIGNAMGYVRMIRAGGRHCCADATVFLPSLENIKSFKTLAEESELNQTTLESADIIDRNIESLISNFTQGTEYFKLLVDVFAEIFRNPKNVHLKNFFVIIPPLTLNFVEHMILCKDKMSKKNKVGAAFTDDGFAMGVAYILKLLDQDANFESLHWFESVWRHIAEERKLVEEQKSKGSQQLQTALVLTEKKLKILEEEFLLLYYSLTSARIFFR